MIKFTSQSLIQRAKALADLENSSFITWSDNYQMLNSVYRVVYQDMIQAGELAYLKEIRLLTYGTSTFKLPDDFYQMAMLCDEYGNEIPLRRLDSSVADIGYEIKNNTISLYNVRNNIILKYYPVPETITYKAQRTKPIEFPTGTYPVSAFGTEVLLSDGRIFDVSSQTITYNTKRTFTNPILGASSIIDDKKVYWKDGTAVVDTLVHPQIRPDGSFLEGDSGDFSWANDDSTAVYTLIDDAIYHNDIAICPKTTEARVIYWDGQWCLLTKDAIYYPDGSYLTTDSKASTLLKADFNTGYGYLIRVGENKYAIEGFTPDTTIDYPNNVLFDITAYRLAIQYRMKQNSDSSALQREEVQLTKSYYASISNTKDYPVIRNVDGRYKYGWF